MTAPTPIEAFDQASLEAFTSELVGAGFEPRPGTERKLWRGPIDPAFAPLTDARIMTIVLRDGWPVTYPYILVDGIHTNHLTPEGYVCMWQDDDGSGTWTTLTGLRGRIQEWCHDAQNGWDPRDLARDAYLNFTNKLGAVATLDLDGLELAGTHGYIHAIIRYPGHVELRSGQRRTGDDLGVMWFTVDDLDVPPRNTDELWRCLSGPQAKALKRELAQRRDVGYLTAGGTCDVILLRWDRGDARDVMVVAATGSGPATEMAALLHGFTNEQSLLLRAGPDAEELRSKRVALFGVGALGGHVAMALAESGVGHLRLVDDDVLLPGNAVRHLAGHSAIGLLKAQAVAMMLRDHAPWTNAEMINAAPLKPSAIRELLADIDMVVDATGSLPATHALAPTAAALARPLVSGALYRGGTIARIQRQAIAEDTDILARPGNTAYLQIPSGEDDDLVEPAIGCSAPINNAPPSAVIACAALITQAAIDCITQRYELSDEVVDVYRALLDEPPFDRPGRIRPRT